MRLPRSSLLAVALLAAGCAPTGKDHANSPIARPASEGGAGKLELKALSYRAEIVGFDDKGRHTTSIAQVPDHAVRFGPGLLMGSSRGEWGGELIYRDAEGKDAVLLTENVLGIFVSPRGAIVFTGLAHLGIDEGAVYEIQMSAKPNVRIVHKLIGEPREIDQVGDVFHVSFRQYELAGVDGQSKQVDRCYTIDRGLALVETQCRELRPNNSSKPKPLRGSA